MAFPKAEEPRCRKPPLPRGAGPVAQEAPGRCPAEEGARCSSGQRGRCLDLPFKQLRSLHGDLSAVGKIGLICSSVQRERSEFLYPFKPAPQTLHLLSPPIHAPFAEQRLRPDPTAPARHPAPPPCAGLYRFAAIFPDSSLGRDRERWLTWEWGQGAIGSVLPWPVAMAGERFTAKGAEKSKWSQYG